MIGEIAVSLILLLLAFFAIASSDVSPASAHRYWAMLVACYAVVAVIADRFQMHHRIIDSKSAIWIVLHWLGVFGAIELIFYFAHSGRFNNADIGLANAVILALGTYLFGIAKNWRFIVIGCALAAASVGVAMVEQYLWVLVGIAVLVALVLGALSYLNHRRT
ncbi:hypothetical protein [Pseudoruegeria sp. SK021]|uniref:hypothetical protein n=1 Tax=Pseudoruegeria sp. SK021 TaxID=1933035 RepID=UPI000A265983|nr:hypothetical protein [Pseudoruegeria sp. SK021]OSP54051.1 hypothetical protein BV911_14645 [Pseudoruegeria sp. SK021]